MADQPFDLDAGTHGFYEDAVYYDHEFQNRRADAAWYAARCRDAGGPVLELGVGTGRVALRAARAGAEIIGLDLSRTMLERCAQRRQGLPKSARARLHLVRGDMRRFAFGRQFPLIICPFNAFQHLYTRADVEACLASVKAHLAPGGRFIFDMLMPDMEYLMRPPTKWFQGIKFKHPTFAGHYIYAERSAYDPVTQLNQIWFHYERSDAEEDIPTGKDAERPLGPKHVEVQLSHRYFYPAELEALLHYAGFYIEHRFGDFEEGPLDGDAESMLIAAKVRG